MRLLGTPQSNHHLTFGYHNYIQSVGDVTYIPIKMSDIPTIGPLTEVAIGFTNAAITTIITVL